MFPIHNIFSTFDLIKFRFFDFKTVANQLLTFNSYGLHIHIFFRDSFYITLRVILIFSKKTNFVLDFIDSMVYLVNVYFKTDRHWTSKRNQKRQRFMFTIGICGFAHKIFRTCSFFKYHPKTFLSSQITVCIDRQICLWMYRISYSPLLVSFSVCLCTHLSAK